MIAAIRAAKERAKSPSELEQLIIVPHLNKPWQDEGFRYYSDLGISVQGQDANGAWRAACHIAQNLGLPLTVTFVWREKEGAAFPGITGRFHIPPR